MEKDDFIYEGKAKRLYKSDKEGEIIIEFKDDLTAFNAKKRSSEEGKGALNCAIASKIFTMLESEGIKTHFIKQIDSNHMLAKRCEIIPIEVIVRNIAAGSLSKRLGIEDGKILPFSLVEFCYKDDTLEDPLINDEHALILGCVAHESELEELKRVAREINVILKAFFDERGLILVDFKLEFGRDSEGNIILADEITPDSCRLWDKKSREKLDKDLFREGKGSIKAAYEEVLKRVLGE